MPARSTTALLVLLALLVLACEGSGDIGGPRPTPSSPASTAAPPADPVTMVALGDSITAGFGSCLALTTCHRNSWSTGEGLRVESVYRRLLAAEPGLRGDTRNLAVPGARVAALPGQAAAAVEARADLVTVLIGANDACRGGIDEMTPVGQFRTKLDEALGTLRKGRPKARVLVVSIPDLYRLWEIGHTDSRATRAWARGICPALLANATSTAEADVRRRAAFRDRVRAYNAELSAACRAYGGRCRYDGNAVHRVRFELDLVNRLDYFHPNVAGQNRIAEVAWAAARWG